jgi:GNAT superfamily N-acetyltransferase
LQIDWTIRKAVIADAARLQRCMESAYASYQQRMAGQRLPPMDLDYDAEIQDFPTWVAEREGVIGGGLTMVFEDDYASIANIAVHPRFQGQGLGGALLRFAEIQAKDGSFSELRLTTHVQLVENISLYSHLGWNEYQRDNTRVYMKKTL